MNGPILNPIAHVLQVSRDVHDAEAHAIDVSILASSFADGFGAASWGELAGRWHDLGKYSDAFQRYIRAVSGYEAHLVDSQPGKVNHSSAGALYALEKLGAAGLPLAYLIAGHHAGLPDWFGDEGGASTLEKRLQEGGRGGLLAQALAADIPSEVLAAETPQFDPARFGGMDGLHLWIRMLFSCLVDADFLDTEAFMDKSRAVLRGGYPAITTLLGQFNSAMAEKATKAEPTPVNIIRADILRQCREKAALPPGIFTLTVPTGGGKTLSSMAFALEHAIRHQKKRIVYAIPYTSIIEQTAEVFRGIFGEAVLEHHSNFDSEKETPESRLAAENWDAPLVVTTNVQLFESLFANKTSRCRKLHNIVNSVIVLDEAQLLPPEFLQPILDVMRLLVAHYGVTFVLCTATQPALGSRKDSFGRSWLRGLDGATEIIDDVDGLYAKLERVQVALPADLNTPGNWDDIAEEVAAHESVLAIVSTRNDCRELHRRMPKGTIHLSALMCGEHRSATISSIKRDLENGQPVRVVSTQLVEAGVDVDFPVVYRALAGLDSIAQAAGRCNREGRLGSMGNVQVFVPPKAPPQGLLRFAADSGKAVLYNRPEKPLTPSLFGRYFADYYAKSGKEGLDKKGIGALLTKDARDCKIQFRSAADKFRLIEEGNTTAVIVPYQSPDEPTRDSRPLIARLRKGELHRDLLRQLQRYSVTVYERDFNKLYRQGDLDEIVPGLFVLKNETAYHPELGLLVGDEENPSPDQLMA